MMDWIFFFIGFFFSVAFHELAHAQVALMCGDDTAKRLGRITLNPIKHIDLFWTIMLPVTLILLKSPFVIGSAKPVPVNFLKLHHPRRDMALVAVAGPLVNFILAMGFKICFQLSEYRVFLYLFLLNIFLFLFNLLPIPPMDGSRILRSFLPAKPAKILDRIEPYGFLLVLLLWYLGFFRYFFEQVVTRFL